MDMYKGLFVVTTKDFMQKVTPADKMNTVDETKLFKVVKQGQEGPFKLIPASKTDVEVIKKQNRLSSLQAGFKQDVTNGKRFSTIAPKPHVVVQNIQGVTMTTITMTTPVTQKPVNVISPDGWQSQTDNNPATVCNKTVLSDNRQLGGGTYESNLPSKGVSTPVIVVKRSTKSFTTGSPVMSFTVPSDVSSQYTGSLSHLSPSSSVLSTDTVTVPNPVFVIRPSVSQVMGNTSRSGGIYDKSLLTGSQQIPVTTSNVTQRNTIQLTGPQPASGMGNSKVLNISKMTVPSPRYVAVPALRPKSNSQTFIDNMSGEKRTFVVNWNNKAGLDTMSKSKPVHKVFPASTAATQNSTPIVYPSDISSPNSPATKATFRPASMVSRLSSSLLGRATAAASSSKTASTRGVLGSAQQLSCSYSSASRREKEDTTMDLKIDSVFSLAQASELWDDDDCKGLKDNQEKRKGGVIEISDDDTENVDSQLLGEGTEDANEKETIKLSKTKANEMIGEQMQVNIAQMAIKQMSRILQNGAKKTADKEDEVIHVVFNEEDSDLEDSVPEISDDNFRFELGDVSFLNQCQLAKDAFCNRRKQTLPVKASNVQSTLFTVQDNTQETNKMENLADSTRETVEVKKQTKHKEPKEVEKKHTIQNIDDSAAESLKGMFKLTATYAGEKDVSYTMLSDEKPDDSETSNQFRDGSSIDHEKDIKCSSEPKGISSNQNINIPVDNDALVNQCNDKTSENEIAEENTDEEVTLEPELIEPTESAGDETDDISSYPELIPERATDDEFVNSVLNTMERSIKKRKQIYPEKLVPNSVLHEKDKKNKNSLEVRHNKCINSKSDNGVLPNLARTSYTIQEAKRTSSQKKQRFRRTPTPPVNDTSVTLEKSEINESRRPQLPKQIKIIAIPTGKTSSEISARVKSCVSFNPNTSTQSIASGQVSATQGFLRVIKGGHVQLVPIRITHGPKGMLLTPIEGDLASQATDETSLKPVPTLEKYKDIPIFGPSVEELCSSTSSQKDITDALEQSSLREEDISDLEKVFECVECKICQKDLVNLTKQQPVFQRPHNSTFDYRPWSLIEERIACKFYNCQDCSIKLDRLTISSYQKVNINKVLQAQLYCGFDYVSDSSCDDEISDDEETLLDSRLDCQEVCVKIGDGISQESTLRSEGFGEIRSIVTGANQNIYQDIYTSSDNNDQSDDNSTEPNSQMVKRFRTNGFINESVDPTVDHCYHLKEDDVFSDGVEECVDDGLYDLYDDIEETSNNDENEQEDSIRKNTENNRPDDADICRSVLLDCMDISPDKPTTEIGTDISESPVSESKQSENLETVSLSSDEDAVVTKDKTLEEDGYSDHYSATSCDSEEFSDTEIDELPSRPNLDSRTSSHKDCEGTSPIVIAPIVDEEYGFCDEQNTTQNSGLEVRTETCFSTNHQFSYITDNVVGEVNIKTESENTMDETLFGADWSHNADCSVVENVGIEHHWAADGNIIVPDFEVHCTPKSSKVPKKKKRRSSSAESGESKETFQIKVPEQFRHIPIMHNYCILPDGVSYAKREKSAESIGKVPKVRRSEKADSEEREPKTVSLPTKPTKGVVMVVKDKPTFFFRVSADNKLVNVEDAGKVHTTTSLLKPVKPAKLQITLGPEELKTSVPQGPVSNQSVSVPSMASISAESVSNLTSLLASETRGAISNTSTTTSGNSVNVPIVAPGAEKSLSPASRPGSSLIKSILKEADVRKSQEPKLLSLLKPLNLQPGAKIKFKKISVGPDLKEPSTSNKSSSDNTSEKTDPSKSRSPKLAKLQFVSGQATLTPKEKSVTAGEPDAKESEEPVQDDLFKEGADVLKLEDDTDAVTKRKLDPDDVTELDTKKPKFDVKEDRIKKLKDRLRKQEEELEQIKREREATKTLLSLFESDT